MVRLDCKAVSFQETVKIVTTHTKVRRFCAFCLTSVLFRFNSEANIQQDSYFHLLVPEGVHTRLTYRKLWVLACTDRYFPIEPALLGS